ncbi:hypothetical protein ZWY2020_040438 [Hordeum vulgare]|nr:hypothetical protein ZWY2020_040438 [Hordeum vulgare]
MLSEYAGRFSKDAEFRRALQEKCAACLAPAGEAAAEEHAVLLAIESIERLADASPSPRDSKIRSLRNSIHLLGVVAVLHAPPGPADSGEGDARGVPSSHLSACAQLYLTVVYKMESDPHLLHSS